MEWDCLVDHPYRGTLYRDQRLPRWWHWVLWVTIAYFVVGFSSVPGVAIGPGGIELAEKKTADAGARYDPFGPVRKTGDHARMPRAVSPAEVAVGRAVFVKNCSQCHQADGGGLIGPNLTDRYWIHGGTAKEIYRTVREGVAAKNMPGWGRVLSPDRLSATVAFVLSLRGTTPAKPKGPQGVDADSAAAPSGWAARALRPPWEVLQDDESRVPLRPRRVSAG